MALIKFVDASLAILGAMVGVRLAALTSLHLTRVGLLEVFGRVPEAGDVPVLVERRRPPECMGRSQEAATIMRRAHLQLVSHSFE